MPIARLIVWFALVMGVLGGCHPRPPSDPVPPHETIRLESQAVRETRVVNVWQPDVDPGVALPVLYMPDGGVAEDFPHIANTVAELIARGDIPPMRVVGIENTDRKRDLTGPTTVASDRALLPSNGGSAAFRAFIRDELVPTIEARYACDGRRAIIGESLAGNFVAEAFVREPELFDAYIAISPSLWWNGAGIVEELRARRGSLPPERTIFLTSANETDIAVNVAAFAELLEQTEVRWTYRPRTDLRHHTIFRAMKVEALTWALAAWVPEAA